ncbi:uncharacterized protein EV422DRAFT_614367 [Fimicolochytrium jonesii]|uniref:uncharacterized protein n=1 Tax=Fimicolochytrium jonesii TaxID=1396493 RepID=UPI0022FE83F1|nr:uncharacterized protein EV422DRAFT_614367 [Fimicolochytrium jonesii]KAI8822043.1 hypothetical protein EV422DRAFT_614367 [Fimicolochytrium jonesii]
MCPGPRHIQLPLEWHPVPFFGTKDEGHVPHWLDPSAHTCSKKARKSWLASEREDTIFTPVRLLQEIQRDIAVRHIPPPAPPPNPLKHGHQIPSRIELGLKLRLSYRFPRALSIPESSYSSHEDTFWKVRRGTEFEKRVHIPEALFNHRSVHLSRVLNVKGRVIVPVVLVHNRWAGPIRPMAEMTWLRPMAHRAECVSVTDGQNARGG